MGSRYPAKRTPEKSNEIDQVATEIIKGINGLIVQAQMGNLALISSVLEDARESIAWWAAYDDFNQSPDETLAEQLKLTSGLTVAAALLAKLSVIKDEQIKKEMLDLMQTIAPLRKTA